MIVTTTTVAIKLTVHKDGSVGIDIPASVLAAALTDPTADVTVKQYGSDDTDATAEQRAAAAAALTKTAFLGTLHTGSR